MPTDTTIIDRLRAEAEWFGSRKWGDTGLKQHGEAAAAAMRDAADALTAAHAARDAAERAKRVTFCHFCLVKVDLNGMTPPEALDALKAHSLTCPESPIVAALTTALRERDEARAKLTKRPTLDTVC